jgi:hypothetical protein
VAVLAAGIQLGCLTPDRYVPGPDAGQFDDVGAPGGDGAADASRASVPDAAEGSDVTRQAFDGTPPADLVSAADGCGGDCTPPTIIANAIVPANNSTGVRSDTKISIAFSEPMNRQTTEAAFASSDIPSRTYSWDSSGTILTVTPAGGLAYATGTDPALAPLSYSFSLTTTATDLAGNHLQGGSAVTFSTLRKITLEVGVVPQMSGNVADGGETIVDDRWASAGCDANEENRAFVTFNLSGLPAAIAGLDGAELALTDNTTAPPPSLGAVVSVGHIVFSTTGPSLFGVQSDALGTLARSGQISRLSNSALRDAVWADYADRTNRSNRSQYRMRVEVQCPSTPPNARSDYDPQLSRLSITYLIK